MSSDILAAKLRAANYSATKPRLAVFTMLQQHDSITIRELVEGLRGTVDRASVYRTVDLFEKLDIVHRIYNGWKYKLELSDDFMHHHHHLTCTICGRVISIVEDTELSKIIDRMSTMHNFTVTNHQFELTGVCQSCATA